MPQVAIDIALPRTRLGKISESTTQLKGASDKVNAPVGTSIAVKVSGVASGRCSSGTSENGQPPWRSCPVIRIERRVNVCVSQKAATVQSVIQPQMKTLLRMASESLVIPASWTELARR